MRIAEVSVGASLAMTREFFLICRMVVGRIFKIAYRLKN